MQNFFIKEDFIAFDDLIEGVEHFLLRECFLSFKLVEESAIPAVLHQYVVIALRVALYRPHANQVGMRRQLMENSQLPFDHFAPGTLQRYDFDN